MNKLSFLGLYISPQWCDLHAQKGTILAGLSLSTTPSSEESLLQIRSSLGNAISTFRPHLSSIFITYILHFLKFAGMLLGTKTK